MLKSAPLHLFFLSEGDEIHPSDHPSKSPPSRAIFHDMDGVQFSKEASVGAHSPKTFTYSEIKAMFGAELFWVMSGENELFYF